MSQMQPQQTGPDMAALLAQLGGGQQSAPEQDDQQGNWLVDAINALHRGEEEETDPHVVHDITKAKGLLTQLQALLAGPRAKA